MKRLIICLMLLILCISPALAYDWYTGAPGENVTTGLSLNQSCQYWATADGQNPNFWFRRTAAQGGGTNLLRQYYAVGATDHDMGQSVQPWETSGHVIDDLNPGAAGYNNVAYHLYCCLNTTSNCAAKVIVNWTWAQGTRPPVIADFNASAVSVQTGTPITLYDNSSGDAAWSWNWSASPAATAYLSSPLAINTGAIFTAAGNYTITHGVASPYSSDIETKIEYINVFGGESMVTTAYAPIDGRSSAKVNHAAINIYDIENATWTNTSDINGGLAFITSLATHNLNAYASATGYQDNDLLNQPARDQSLGAYTILLWPDGYYNLTPGNVTLYVYATSKTEGGPIPDVQIQASTSSDSQVQFTNAAGTASFTFPNQTNVYVWGHKAGWQDASVVVNTGTGNGGDASIPAYLEMYPIGVTPTQPNATPTPTVTVCDENGCHVVTTATPDPYPCVGDGSYQDTLNCQRKQGAIGADLIGLWPMLQGFFVMLIIVGGLKLILKW